MKIQKWVEVTFRMPVDLEMGDAGLCYLTSPLIRGLLVAEQTDAAAIGALPKALEDLACASAVVRL